MYHIITNVRFQKMSIPGREVSPKKELEIPGGWGIKPKNLLLGRGMDIFWNHTIIQEMGKTMPNMPLILLPNYREKAPLSLLSRGSQVAGLSVYILTLSTKSRLYFTDTRALCLRTLFFTLKQKDHLKFLQSLPFRTSHHSVVCLCFFSSLQQLILMKTMS